MSGGRGRTREDSTAPAQGELHQGWAPSLWAMSFPSLRLSFPKYMRKNGRPEAVSVFDGGC